MKKNEEDKHWRTVLNTKFLSGDELPKEGKVVTILGYKKEIFFSPKAKADEEHIVLNLKGVVKPVILSNRKSKQISKALDTPYMNKWIGGNILLFPVKEKHFGEYFNVITIKKATLAPKMELTPESPKWAQALESYKAGTITEETIKSYYKISDVNMLKIKNGG